MPGRVEEAVAAYVSARDWPHEVGPGVVSIPGFGTNGAWTILVTIREDDEQIVVHSIVPDVVPEERRAAVALFLTRANFGLVLGNFELDLDAGELRYKTSVDVEGTPVVDRLLDNLVRSNVATLDRYLPGIRAVVGGADPADAVASIEAGPG